MCEKDRNSAQCAWLFSHAHLTGKTSIELKDGIQIYFSVLSFVLVASGATFLELLAPFLTGFATGLPFVGFLVVFLTMFLAFGSDLRCCFSRSSRNNSS